MGELIPVNVLIADRTYRIRVDKKDEEKVRKTASLLNQKIAEFKVQFAGKDMQDFVSMALLWFATEQKEETDMVLQREAAIQELSDMEQLIRQTLGTTS
jgi:cell division protein ZapA (FtsZ GTPase activity inhibitor)